MKLNIRLESCRIADDRSYTLNTLRPRQNGRHFADDVFKCIFLNEYVCILLKISLKFVAKGPINNIPSLVQVMAWRRSGDKPLSEPMMVSLMTHICVARPQWVNNFIKIYVYWITHHPRAWVMRFCHHSKYDQMTQYTYIWTDYVNA